MTQIQWRIREKERNSPGQAKWKDHSQVSDSEAARLIEAYNDNDNFFEYRATKVKKREQQKQQS